MMRRIPGSAGAFLILLAAASLAAGERLEMGEQQMKNIGVRIVSPEKVENAVFGHLPGVVSVPPSRDYIVSAPQAGLISSIRIAEGEQAAKGEILAQIESPDLVKLQTELLNGVRALELARAALRRDEKLLIEGVIAERRWLETQNDYQRRQTAVEELRQLVSIAGMDQTAIDTLLNTHRLTSRLDIRSPVDGTVLERMAAVGQRVEILAPLFRVASLNDLWVEISVPQEYLASIRNGDRVVIEPGDLPARIVLIGRSVSPSSQTVPVRAALEGRPAHIRPGQTVSARLLRKDEQTLWMVPSHAVVSSGGRHYVFVRTAYGFEVRPVDVAFSDEERVMLRSGLQPGERIALHGVVHLKALWTGAGAGE